LGSDAAVSVFKTGDECLAWGYMIAGDFDLFEALN
jgi:hypothetical protein